MRVAFCGASGTGKTTLTQAISEQLGLPFNPVGSRQIAQEMGFQSPYEMDKAGKRREFQVRLLNAKYTWETSHREFITDRTPLDNLVYTMFHDIHGLDESYLQKVKLGMERYTHLIYCPVNVFCRTNGDPSRVPELTYHTLYDYTMQGLLANFPKPNVFKLTKSNVEDRTLACLDFLSKRTA